MCDSAHLCGYMVNCSFANKGIQVNQKFRKGNIGMPLLSSKQSPYACNTIYGDRENKAGGGMYIHVYLASYLSLLS